jgi:hypothetical protein
MWFERLRQDIRYALRTAVRVPLFALTAAVSVALGIGADTAVFSVANALLLRPPDGVPAHSELLAMSTIDDARFGINEIWFPDFAMRGG